MLNALFDSHPLHAYALVFVLLFGASSFFVLLFVSAPYGRHVRDGWGPTIPAKLGWVLMEAPSPIGFAIAFFASGGASSAVRGLLAALYLLHYVDRAFVFPLRMRGDGKRKPLLVALLAVVFNVCNGALNGHAIAALAPHLDSDWMGDPRFAIGLGLFGFGYYANQRSDAILRNLRAPGESGYKVPHGFLYRWVSAPNYLGEILEWIGFAIACWTPAGAAFAFFTFCNLAPRALTNHRWYLEKFPDYPRGRRALVPYVF